MAEESSSGEIISKERQGVYASVSQALGPEICQALDSPLTYVVDRQRFDNTSAKDIAQAWGEEAKVSVFFIGGKELKFLIERELGNGRKVLVVADLADVELVGDYTKRVTVFEVEKLIIKGPGESCVCFNERLPEGTGVLMTSYPRGRDEEEPLKPEIKEYVFDTIDNQVRFDQIASAVDIGSLWHEAGHAFLLANSTEEERGLRNNARGVSGLIKKAYVRGDFASVAEIEKKAKLDFWSARRSVTSEEEAASLWALKDLHLVSDVLGINEELVEQIPQKFEKNFQSYDTPYHPDVVISKLARNISQESADEVLVHYAQFAELCQLTDALDLSLGGKTFFKTREGAILSVERDISGIISMLYQFPDFSSKRGFLTVDAFGAIVDFYDRKQKGQRERGEFSLVLPFKGVDDLDNMRRVNEVEVFFLEELRLMVGIREKRVEEKIDWLKEVFKPMFPAIEQADPKIFVKKEGIASIIKSDEVNSESELQEMATKPSIRLDFLSRFIVSRACWRLGEDEKQFLDPQHLKFDPKTGQSITHDWQRLVIFCEQVIDSLDPDSTIPDRLSAKDTRLVEIEIISQAAELLAHYEKN